MKSQTPKMVSNGLKFEIWQFRVFLDQFYSMSFTCFVSVLSWKFLEYKSNILFWTSLGIKTSNSFETGKTLKSESKSLPIPRCFWVDFTNILHAVFTRADPKRAKRHWWLDFLLTLLGSSRVKASRKQYLQFHYDWGPQKGQVDVTEQRVERIPWSTKYEARSCKIRSWSSCSTGGRSPVKKVIDCKEQIS